MEDDNESWGNDNGSDHDSWYEESILDEMYDFEQEFDLK